jgi:hypothetical protein
MLLRSQGVLTAKKVAGRKPMVNAAMDFIDMLSRLVERAISVEVS